MVYHISQDKVGGVPRSVDDVTPDVADRELHGAVVRATAKLGRGTGWSFTDMRRKRNRPWGHVLRMIDELVEAGVSTDRIVLIGALVRAYAIERCMERSARLYGSPKSAA